MQATGYPHCCTTDVIYGLGSSQNMDYSSQEAARKHPSLSDKVNYVHNHMSRNLSIAMLTAITTDQHKDACKVFRALGWRCGPWAKSRAHPNTKTRLWYWLAQDGTPALGNVRKQLGLDS